MIISSISDFTNIIPTAEGTQFSAIEPFLSQAENQVKILLLGKDLFDLINAKELTDMAKIQTKVLIAHMAYHDAIPFTDLIQTPTGFAVVSNSNQAPASKERVERLISWVKYAIDRQTDMLINLVYSTPDLLTEWKKFNLFNDLINCFFFTGIDYGFHVNVGAKEKREQFLGDKGKLITFQENILAPVISKAYLDQLITEIRNNNTSAGSANIINQCKMILARLIEGNKEESVKLLNAISNILESNLNTYATYANSDEYKLKTSEKYKNTADAPAFFFGI